MIEDLNRPCLIKDAAEIAAHRSPLSPLTCRRIAILLTGGQIHQDGKEEPATWGPLPPRWILAVSELATALNLDPVELAQVLRDLAHPPAESRSDDPADARALEPVEGAGAVLWKLEQVGVALGGLSNQLNAQDARLADLVGRLAELEHGGRRPALARPADAAGKPRPPDPDTVSESHG